MKVYQLWALLSIAGSTYFGGKVGKTEARIGNGGNQAIGGSGSRYQGIGASGIENQESSIKNRLFLCVLCGLGG